MRRRTSRLTVVDVVAIRTLRAAWLPRQPKIELASMDEAAEKVSRTSEAVGDLTRQASFEPNPEKSAAFRRLRSGCHVPPGPGAR